MDAKLGEERGYVNLDRPLGELERTRYFLIGQTLDDQIQDLSLTDA